MAAPRARSDCTDGTASARELQPRGAGEIPRSRVRYRRHPDPVVSTIPWHTLPIMELPQATAFWFALGVALWWGVVLVQAASRRVDLVARRELACWISSIAAVFHYLHLWGMAEMEGFAFSLTLVLQVVWIPVCGAGVLYALATGFGAWRRFGWLSFQGFGVYLLLLLALAAYYQAGFPSFRPFSDDALVRYHRMHRDEFGRLATMVREDDLAAVVKPPYVGNGRGLDHTEAHDSGWNFRHASPSARELAEQRKREYAQLLDLIDLRRGVLLRENGDVVFDFWHISLGALDSSGVGRAFMNSTRGSACTSRKGSVCRPIEEGWFLIG